MIDTKARLHKLMNESKTYEGFRAAAIARASWVLAPYVAAGNRVDNVWLAEFWKTGKGI